jgi:hypothetical protein
MPMAPRGSGGTTRPSRIAPLSPEVARRVVALTLPGPPPAASHWTGSARAKACAISVSSVKRHRHQEFSRFLNVSDARVAKKKTVHVIVDNYATHKHPNVIERLEKHPRFVFHFTPTSASWLNARAVLCQAHEKPSQTRRIQIPAGTQRCHSPLSRGKQRKSKTFHLDQA